MTLVTLTDTTDADTRRHLLSYATSWKNLPSLPAGSRCIGAPDWLPSGENPLLRHHPTAVARDTLLVVVDRVLSAVEEDEDFDDVQKVKMMRNYDRVDSYIAALKELAI